MSGQRHSVTAVGRHIGSIAHAGRVIATATALTALLGAPPAAPRRVRPRKRDNRRLSAARPPARAVLTSTTAAAAEAASASGIDAAERKEAAQRRRRMTACRAVEASRAQEHGCEAQYPGVGRSGGQCRHVSRLPGRRIPVKGSGQAAKVRARAGARAVRRTRVCSGGRRGGPGRWPVPRHPRRPAESRSTSQQHRCRPAAQPGAGSKQARGQRKRQRCLEAGRRCRLRTHARDQTAKTRDFESSRA